MNRLTPLAVSLVFSLTIIALAFRLLVPTNKAIALSNSNVDTTHLNAGTLVFRGLPQYGGALVSYCSGILIAPQVFLTAGHCTDTFNGWLNEGLIQAAYVTFDTQLTQTSSLVEVVELVTDPEYYGGSQNPQGLTTGQATPDLGVVLLAAPASQTSAALPTANLLGSLHLKPDTPVTAVGYGLQSNDVHGYHSPFFTLTDDGGIRSAGSLAYRSLLPDLIHVTMLANQGNDNFCYGDSGGPDFVQINGQEQLVAVNVFVNGSKTCEEQGWLQRLDTPQARAFLGQYVTLP